MTDGLIDILVERLNGLMPRVAIVLGSGLGSLVEEVSDPVRVPYADLPGFPAGGVSGHAGELVAGYLGGEPVMMLSGRVHFYEKGDPAAMRPVIEALAGLGVQSLILTNSAGSVRQDMPPGSVMQITDHINYSGMNPLIGEESDRRFIACYEFTVGNDQIDFIGTIADRGFGFRHDSRDIKIARGKIDDGGDADRVFFAESRTRLSHETRPDADGGGVAIIRMRPLAQSGDLLGRAIFLKIGQVQQGQSEGSRFARTLEFHGHAPPEIISFRIAASRLPPTGAMSLVSSWLSSAPVMPAP